MKKDARATYRCNKSREKWAEGLIRVQNAHFHATPTLFFFSHSRSLWLPNLWGSPPGSRNMNTQFVGINEPPVASAKRVPILVLILFPYH
jgi:hypothetical protein